MNTTKYLDSTFPYLLLSDTGEEALELMSELKTAHLPVIDKGKLEGIISEEEILTRGHEVRIGEAEESLKKIAIEEHRHFVEAINIIAEQSISILPVIDEHGNYLGVIKESDAIRGIHEALTLAERGATIILEMQYYQYSLIEIAQIFENEGVRIMFLTTTTKENNPNIIQLHIKTNTQNLEPLIPALQRYEYNIVEMTNENSYTETLKRRYDALMTYLNV